MSAQREVVAADGAPAAIGPSSHAIRTGDLLFCSGQIPLDPAGRLVGDGPAEQARQCLANLAAVCAAGGFDLRNAVRCTVYMTDLGAFSEVNEVYGAFFGEADPPARVAIGVAALPRGAQVEIDAVVALGT